MPVYEYFCKSCEGSSSRSSDREGVGAFTVSCLREEGAADAAVIVLGVHDA
jgi:hypothetical protein